MTTLDAMNLNETQRLTVAGWVAGGSKISEVQNRLAAELGVRLTYMEVRLLVDDLKLKLKDPEVPPPAAPATTPNLPVASPAAPTAPLPPAAAGTVSLSLDQITRPGALVSGKVTFSDGMNADWYLDQSGRMGVVPQQQGYKPSAVDVQQFQLALEREMTKLGL